MTAIGELAAYVQQRVPGARLELTELPQVPQIELYLLNADYPQHRLSDEQATQLMDAPPYWSFCWASGQVLAQYLLANPATVAGRQVIDFGSGSGVVAIAAALAGARRVIACDEDPMARQASSINAQHNGVAVSTCASVSEACELLIDAQLNEAVICIADVFYDRDNLPLLDRFNSLFGHVMVADSRLKGGCLPGLRKIQNLTSHTVPNLNESDEFNSVNLYRTDECRLQKQALAR